MKKIVTFLSLIMMPGMFVFAQTHYVIAFDCTKSMDHPNAFFDKDYSAEARDVSRVWEPAKKSVIDIFDEALDDDNFTIILFQNRVLDIIEGKKAELSWSSIDVRMEKVITDNGGNTCILSAWECAEKYFGKSNNNLFFLITDGVEDHLGDRPNDDYQAKQHTTLLCNKIYDFCSTHSNTRGFYTNLVRTLHDLDNNAINKALIKSDCFKNRIIGSFDSIVYVDMDEERQNYNQLKSIIFYPKDRDRVPVTINGIEISSSDDYFTIQSPSGEVCNNKFEVQLSLRNKDSLPYDLINNQYYSFFAKIESSSLAKEIVDSQIIEIRINFKRSSVAFLPKNELLGKSSYQKPFKLFEKILPQIAAEKSPTPIRFDIDSIVNAQQNVVGVFNEEAIRKKAQIEVALKSRNHKAVPPMTMYYNGKLCENLTATIQATDNNHIIELFFDKHAQSGIYNNLQFVVVDGSVCNLNRINSDTSCQYKNDVTLNFVVKSNPWYVAFLWILAFLVSIILAWIIIANLPFRKMVGRLMPEGMAPVVLNGNVRAVFVSKKQKQNLLSALIYGPCVYSVPNEFWTNDLVVKKGRKYDMVSIITSKDYMINGEIRTYPFPVHRNASFEVQNIHTGNKVTIKYI